MTISERIEQLDDMPHGTLRLELAERLLAAARESRDPVTIFEALNEVVRSAKFANQIDQCLVRFAELVTVFDDHSSELSENAVAFLWKFKHCISAALSHPEIPLEKVESLLADFRDRSLRLGFSARTYLRYRAFLERERGDRRAETAAMKASLKMPLDEISNCRACEISGVAIWHLRRGRLQKGLEVAIPLLDGRLKCHSVPATLHAFLPTRLFLARRDAEALSLYRRGYRACRRSESLIGSMANIIEFESLTGNLMIAARSIRETWPIIERQDDLEDLFAFHVCVLLHTACARRKKLDRVPVTPPASTGIPVHRGSVRIDDLERFARLEACRIGDRFDARNGNDGFRREMRTTVGLARRMRELSLR